MLLTKSDILAMDDGAYEVVPVAEWGGDIRIRSLMGDQRTRLGKKGTDSASYDAMCCSMGIVDKEGNLVFTEAETTLLAKKHPFVLDQLCNRILALSALTDESRSAALKKWNPIPTNNGGTSSPEQSTPATDSTSKDSSETPPPPA